MEITGISITSELTTYWPVLGMLNFNDWTRTSRTLKAHKESKKILFVP